MALKASIYKLALHISDIDSAFYDAKNLTIAQHPSESNLRLMVRILAYICESRFSPEMTKGLSSTDEPELWVKNDSGEIELWVELGLPSAERLRKAATLSSQVKVYVYGSKKKVNPWLPKVSEVLNRFSNIQLLWVPEECEYPLVELLATAMDLQATLQDGVIWLSSEDANVSVELMKLEADQNA